MMPDVPQLLTLLAVAKALCVSPHTVRSWVKKRASQYPIKRKTLPARPDLPRLPFRPDRPAKRTGHVEGKTNATCCASARFPTRPLDVAKHRPSTHRNHRAHSPP